MKTGVDDCPAPSAVQQYSPFPAGLRMPQPYQVRVDRIYTTKQGMQRRHSTLELLGGDAESVQTDLASQLVAMGYRRMQSPGKDNGTSRIALVSKSDGRINMSASGQIGENPANPRALGLVVLDWPVASTASR